MSRASSMNIEKKLGLLGELRVKTLDRHGASAKPAAPVIRPK